MFFKFKKKIPKEITEKTYDNAIALYKGYNSESYKFLKEAEDKRLKGISLDEVKQLEAKAFSKMKERSKIEELFNRPERGLFMGMGIDLDSDSQGRTIKPCMLEWGNVINNMTWFGTTRYGKTYSMAHVARQYITDGGTGKGQNVIIVDPKGGEDQEILAWAMEFAAEAGREKDIFYVNPMYPEISQYVNPLFGMSNEEISSTVSLLSQGGGTSNSGDGNVFESFAYKVILAEVTALEYLEKVTAREGSVEENVREEVEKYKRFLKMRGLESKGFDELNNIMFPDLADRATANPHKNTSNKKEPLLFGRTLITFRELAHYCQFENLQKLHSAVIVNDIEDDRQDYKRLAGLRRESIALLEEITVKDKAFYDKIVMALSTLLIQLSVGRIGEVFCTIRINPLVAKLTSLDGGLIAVLQPTPLKFRHMADMMLKVFIKMLESVYGVVGVSGRGLARRTTMLLDEAKAAVFPGIEEIYNKAAGLGLSILAYYQSPMDIEFKLGRELAKIVNDNTNTMIYMKVNDGDSREAISRNIGTHTKVNMLFMSGDGDSRGSTSSEEALLVQPRQIGQLPKASAYILHYGKRWRVNLPFQSSPHGKLVMPALQEERLYEVLNSTESKIADVYSDIDDIANSYIFTSDTKAQEEAV